jgi:short-subunit dehydrogenase
MRPAWQRSITPARIAAMLDLRGKTVVITGASAGIGASTAKVCAKRGAIVVLAARRLAELEKVAGEVRALGGTAHVVECDVTSAEANDKLVAEAVAKTGGVDVFIANAGVTMLAAFSRADVATFKRVMDVNYFGVLYGLKAALPHVRARKGQLTVVSSFTGKRGVPTRSGYSASKWAVHGLCEALRVELLGSGVGVTIFCPGFVDTDIRHRAVGIDPSAAAIARPKGESPDVVAERLVRAIERRKREVVTPFSLKLVLWLDALAPSIVDRLLRWKVPTPES